MASFVEQAVLRVVDKSTKQINAVNKALKSLLATSRNLNSVKMLKFPGITKATEDVKKLSAAIRGMPRSKSINFKSTGVAAITTSLRQLTAKKAIGIRIGLTGINSSINRIQTLLGLLAKLRSSGARITVNGALGGNPTAQGKAFGIAARNSMRPNAIGDQIGRAFARTASYAVVAGAAVVGTVAAAAPLNLEDQQQRLRILDKNKTPEEVQKFVNTVSQIALETSVKYPALTQAEIIAASMEAVRTLQDPAQMQIVMERVASNAQAISTGTGLNSTAASESARQLEKVLEILAVQFDPAKAAAFSEAAIQGVIAAGGDIDMAETKRLLQQMATGRLNISPETFAQFITSRDQGGAMDTSGAEQLFTDMTRMNLNKADMRAQKAAGMRDENGRSLVIDQAKADFQGFADNVMRPMLEARNQDADPKNNVDLTNPTEVNIALDQLGFSKQRGMGILSAAIVNSAVNNLMNAGRRNIDVDKAKETETVRQEARAVNSQFQNLSAQILKPMLPFISESLESLSQGMSDMALNPTIENAKKIAGGVTAAGLYAAFEAIADPMARPLGFAAVALMGSAAAITAASAVLGGTSLLGTAAGAAGTVATTSGVTAATVGAFFAKLFRRVGIGAVITEPFFADKSMGLSAPSKETKKFSDLLNGILFDTPEKIKADSNKETAKNIVDAILTTLSAAAEPEARESAMTAAQNSIPRIQDQVPYAPEVKPVAIKVLAPLLPSTNVKKVTDAFQNGATTTEQAIDMSFGRSSTTMQQTFTTGAKQIETSTAAAALAFAPIAGQGILAIAGEFGAIVGRAALAAIGNVNINATVNSPRAASAPRLDTGGLSPYGVGPQ